MTFCDRPRAVQATLLALIVCLACSDGTRSARAEASTPSGTRQTAVSIDRTKFTVNGDVTYPGTIAEGLLLNSRMVQAVFDDENRRTVSMWAYPDTRVWDPERSTNEFVASLPSYAEKGLRAVTINLQGGRPVRNDHPLASKQPWIVSAYKADGSLKPAWLVRLDRVIAACDANGIVVILGLFYAAQDQRLRDEAAVLRATDNTTDWLLARGYTNVLIEINNEAGKGYAHEVLRPAGVAKLIARVEKRSERRLMVSTSVPSGSTTPEAVIRQSDFVLVHGNSRDASGIRSKVAEVKATPAYRANPKPIVFNEDSTRVANLDAAVRAGASWGYFDKGTNNYVDGFQAPPVNWAINTRAKRDFFGHVAALTPRLAFDASSLAFAADEGGGVTSETTGLATNTGSHASYTVDKNASWLRVSPASGQTPAAVTVTPNPAGLAPGTYTAPVTARADGHTPATLTVTLTVTAAASSDDLVVSTSSYRATPAQLAGSTLSGSVYVFTSPDTDVYAVRFYLDDPQMLGAPFATDSSPPYDFAGGTASRAYPFDTRAVSNGWHTITAAVDRWSGETDVVTASFTVVNEAFAS